MYCMSRSRNRRSRRLRHRYMAEEHTTDTFLSKDNVDVVGISMCVRRDRWEMCVSAFWASGTATVSTRSQCTRKTPVKNKSCRWATELKCGGTTTRSTRDCSDPILYYKIRAHTNLIKKYPHFEQSYLLKKSRHKKKKKVRRPNEAVDQGAIFS